MPTKPSVFIGSSSEGLKAANVLQRLLAERVQARIWNDGVIHLGETTIESLVGALHEFDFAVLVFTPDDATSSRNQRQASPRDNVVFELGLFTGGLGRNRSYLVVEDGAGVKIPTDLRGVTYAPYRRAGNIGLEAALAPVAELIHAEIVRRGPRPRIDPAALPALHDVVDFRAAIVGHWWERVMPVDSTALSYVTIDVDPERWTTHLTGLAYGPDGTHGANWETIACAEDPDARRLYYWWKGWHPTRPAEPYEGSGQVDFRAGAAPFTRGDGVFSDTNVLDLGSTRKKAFHLLRCTEAEVAVMEAQAGPQVTALVRRKLRQPV